MLCVVSLQSTLFISSSGTCMGVKQIRVTPTRAAAVQVMSLKTAQTSEWSTQTDVKTVVDCGSQTSITGEDLKTYENRHLKCAEAMHRKCTADYIMKDDTTCIAFTGNVMLYISAYSVAPILAV